MEMIHKQHSIGVISAYTQSVAVKYYFIYLYSISLYVLETNGSCF